MSIHESGPSGEGNKLKQEEDRLRRNAQIRIDNANSTTEIEISRIRAKLDVNIRLLQNVGNRKRLETHLREKASSDIRNIEVKAQDRIEAILKDLYSDLEKLYGKKISPERFRDLVGDNVRINAQEKTFSGDNEFTKQEIKLHEDAEKEFREIDAEFKKEYEDIEKKRSEGLSRVKSGQSAEDEDDIRERVRNRISFISKRAKQKEAVVKARLEAKIRALEKRFNIVRERPKTKESQTVNTDIAKRLSEPGADEEIAEALRKVHDKFKEAGHDPETESISLLNPNKMRRKEKKS